MDRRTPRIADLHCATGPTSTDHEWYGTPPRPSWTWSPALEVTHVMAWAEYGYAANLRLTTEHGFPLRLVVPHLYS